MPCSREHDGEHGHGGEAIRGDVLTATATRQLRCPRELTEMGGRWGSSPCGTQDGPWEFSSSRVDGARRRRAGDPRKKTRPGQRSWAPGVLRLVGEA